MKSVQALIPLLEAENIAKKENKLIRIETNDTYGNLMDGKWESITYELDISDSNIIDSFLRLDKYQESSILSGLSVVSIDSTFMLKVLSNMKL